MLETFLITLWTITISMIGLNSLNELKKNKRNNSFFSLPLDELSTLFLAMSIFYTIIYFIK